MNNLDLINEIKRLKEEKNAIILAHTYEPDEIQAISDYTGDSLYLSQVAKKTDAKIIVFCGVHFMAETAKILSPEKKVLLPEANATCEMAEMIDYLSLKKYKESHPDTKIITYVNSTALVKSLSDCICTSTNAVKIIDYFVKNNNKILYCPDKNLGNYAMKLMNTKFDVWNGCCPIHDGLLKEEVLDTLKKYPNSKIIAHPECKPEVLEVSDYIGSTKQLIEYVKNDNHNEYIVCTEDGVLYQMNKNNPEKIIHIPSKKLRCKNMKLTTLDSLYETLRDEKNEVNVEEDVRIKALDALNLMFKLS
jgi:quinolinate synthase